MNEKSTQRAGGLAALDDVTLTAERQAQLDQAAAGAAGPAVWRQRKLAEARDLLALSQIAPPGRFTVEHLDLDEALRALLLLAVPVPCRPGGEGPLLVERRAMLGLHYPEAALRQVMPGYAFVHVLVPFAVWHANVAPIPEGQAVCLGAQLPAGVRAKELVLMTYGALSMQTVMIDPGDPAGVLNAAAARWWQDNLDRVPLTRTPFLGPLAAAETAT
jgi:hypothetical protein